MIKLLAENGRTRILSLFRLSFGLSVFVLVVLRVHLVYFHLVSLVRIILIDIVPLLHLIDLVFLVLARDDEAAGTCHETHILLHHVSGKLLLSASRFVWVWKTITLLIQWPLQNGWLNWWSLLLAEIHRL